MTAPAPIAAADYARAERRLAQLLGTERDVLLLQGEAILVLEATARGLGGPGVRALNLVSGPYGRMLGEWLAAGGADVVHHVGEFDRAIEPDAVAGLLDGGGFDVVSVVHAEAATGVVNPLAEIAQLAHAAGAVLAVDAVASVGAEPLPIAACDLDLVMLGLQKAPGGPNGVCALAASPRGWERIAANPAAPRGSILSLLDWRERWIEPGRIALPGYAHEHEMAALTRMLDSDLAEGLDAIVGRHRRARDATRAAAAPLGLTPWVVDDAAAASVVTLLRAPDGIAPAELVAAAAPALDGGPAGLLTVAPGELAERALRVNHTGPQARAEPVLAAVSALGHGLRALGGSPDVAAALELAGGAFSP